MSFLNQSGTVKRFSVQAVRGEDVVTELDNDPETDMPCRVEEGRGRVTTTNAGSSVDYDAIMFIPANRDIREGARGVRADEVIVNNSRYKVLKIANTTGAKNPPRLTVYVETLS